MAGCGRQTSSLLHYSFTTALPSLLTVHVTALRRLCSTNDILRALADGDVIVLTVLNLSSAFNTIDHHILLHRLQSLYGTSGTVLLWLESHLTGRTQTVTVNNWSGRSADVSDGDPQCSVFGPILFILYSAPLSPLIETHSVSDQSFADNNQPLHSCPPDQIHATVLTMQTCISDMMTLMTQNNLKLNDDKTEALHIKSDRTTFPNTGFQIMQT